MRRLDRHRGRLLSFKDVRRHIARLYAELVVVDALRCKRSCRNTADIAADHAFARRIRNAREGRNRRRDHVIRRLIEHIHVVHHALRCLLDVVDRRDRRRTHRQSLGLCILRHCLDLNLRIDLTRRVDRADGLGIRIELHQEVNLLCDGREIARPRYVAARGIIRCDDLRTHVVRHSRTDDGDILRRIRGRLYCRRRNRADQVNLVTDKALNDILEVGLIRLRILAVNREVLPLLIAAFLQPVNKPAVCVVK